ncbi:hypothetical protein C7999DRAFT_13309 [Corynascus novoguineensis]|uniref:DUF6536 domain-containing protein n=1 Tax=Corynascus novoguineensis TaxID=1126955 RepID=A0AAN7CX66_9PEZI|nr:hypothetical protein C7999DRAFT_13309 [Corynascus novoguineensis]
MGTHLRGHGSAAYRYTWDDNSEVTQMSSARHSRTLSTERLLLGRRGRQSAHWPFQSIITDTDPPSPNSPSVHRQTTSHPFHPLQSHPVASSLSHQRRRDGEKTNDDALVPEYVRNFLLLRKATPDITIGSSSRTGTPQHRGVELVVPGGGGSSYGDGDGPGAALLHRSRVADLEGFQFEECDDVSLEEEDDDDVGEEDKRFLLMGGNSDSAHVDFGGRGRGWKGFRRRGWRAGITMNLLAMFVVLVTGFVCLIVAISGVSLEEEGRSVVFAGACGTARAMDWGLHAIINVFVVVMVAGANYTFQILSSPTRDEVGAAHWRRDWLNIGVPSLRNLKRIERSRALLAVVVLATALFTPLMYNAVVFVSQTAPNYKAAMVGESFLRGTALNEIPNDGSGLTRADLLTLQRQAARDELVRLPASACIDQFSGAFEVDYSTVLLVSERLDSLALAEGSDTDPISTLIPDRSSIQYCLAQRAPASTCEVNVNAPLLGSVALVNSIALVVTATVLFKRPSSFQPLATLGDAISSFLQDPDPTTQGACLLSKTDVWHGRWPLTAAKCWSPKNNHYWLRSVSFPLWIVTSTLWAVCVGLTAASLAYALNVDHSGVTQRLTPLGTASPHSLLVLPATSPAAAAALVASLPQLLVATLYLTADALLTTYYLSHESSLFAVPAAAGPTAAAWPHPLRVSSTNAPGTAGAQTSSLHLTLPRPVSGVLMAFFAGLSLVLSRSVFAVAVQRVDVRLLSLSTSSSPSDAAAAAVTAAGTDPIVAVGLSGVGLVVLLAALVSLALAVLGLGLRRAPPAGLAAGGRLLGNPMVLPGGSCSAVISARCHPLAREKGLWGKRVMWGVVWEEGVGSIAVSHCGFTAGRAGALEIGRRYG